MISYRVDFMPNDADPLTTEPTVIDIPDRPNARRRATDTARTKSGTRAVSTAYAIATRDGRDTGQRVYSHGRFSHQDGEF